MANNMVDASNQNKMSASQRASFFAQLTREHKQVLPAVAGAENSTVSFQIPKTRLVSKIRLLIQATITVTHSSETAFVPHAMAPFNWLSNVRVEINNGFTPYNVSGIGAYLYQLCRDHADQIVPYVDTAVNVAASRRRNKLGKTASSGGTANVCEFWVDLPLALNDRDPVGLLLAQNEETNITVTVNFGAASSLLSVTTGMTVAATSVTITPVVETFSIPPNPNAFPDISVIKLVKDEYETIAGAGEFTKKFVPGNTFRKMVLFIQDSSGGEADGDITGNFELVFNQADTPYRIPPKYVNALNQEQFGQVLPSGVFVFDFSYQGLANYGGTRDYIDTEGLSEFWFKFQAAGAGSVRAVTEQLARLRY